MKRNGWLVILVGEGNKKKKKKKKESNVDGNVTDTRNSSAGPTCGGKALPAVGVVLSSMGYPLTQRNNTRTPNPQN